MAVKPFQARSKVTHPRTGDDIEYKGGHYVIRTRGSTVQIFQDGSYIDIDAKKLVLVSESPVKWKYDETKKGTPTGTQAPVSKFIVSVNVGGKVDDYALSASSEGAAKNKAVGIVAQKLGVTIPSAQAILKRPPNSISVKRA